MPRNTKSIKLTALAGAGILAVVAGPVTVAAASGRGDSDHGAAKHVLVLSVDGLHQVDLAPYIDRHPGSALAALVSAGTQYTHAQTTFPSDSFAGLVAQFTGGAPATTGVFYDDSFDHELLAAGTRDCRTASAGAEVAYTEGADRSQQPIRLDAGQQLASPTLTALPTNTLAQTLALADSAAGEPGPLAKAILAMTSTPQTLLDPATLPIDPASCQPVYPHSYLLVNTVFEVAQGGRPAHRLVGQAPGV